MTSFVKFVTLSALCSAIASVLAGCGKHECCNVPYIYGQQVPFSGKVLYAKHDVAEGTTVKASDFEARNATEADVPIDAISDASIPDGAEAICAISKENAVYAHSFTGKELPITAPPAGLQEVVGDESEAEMMVIAKRNLAVGTKIAADDIREVRIPGKRIPPDAFRSQSELIGKTLTVPVSANGVVSTNVFSYAPKAIETDSEEEKELQSDSD